MADKIKAKPRFYPVNVTVGQPGAPVTAGTTGRASITVQDVPFVMTRITWALLTFNGLVPPPPDPSWPLGVIPDGFLMVTIKTDTHVYMLEPVVLPAAFGSGLGFQWLELPSAVEIRPKTTFTVELTTMVQRLDAVGVQILLAGIEPDPVQK